MPELRPSAWELRSRGSPSRAVRSRGHDGEGGAAGGVPAEAALRGARSRGHEHHERIPGAGARSTILSARRRAPEQADAGADRALQQPRLHRPHPAVVDRGSDPDPALLRRAPGQGAGRGLGFLRDYKLAQDLPGDLGPSQYPQAARLRAGPARRDDHLPPLALLRQAARGRQARRVASGALLRTSELRARCAAAEADPLRRRMRATGR